MPFKDYKKESRSDWGSDQETALCRDQIQLGAILRIADATEKMANSYQQLIDNRDLYKRWYEEERERTKKLYKRLTATKAWITRLKKQK
jgi:hypothetical protein